MEVGDGLVSTQDLFPLQVGVIFHFNELWEEVFFQKDFRAIGWQLGPPLSITKIMQKKLHYPSFERHILG